jgi:integrase
MAKRKPRKRVKGSGSILPPKGKSRTWGIRWLEDGKRMFESGMLTEDSAKQRLLAITGRLQAGLPGMPESAKVPANRFSELITTFWDSRSSSHRSHKDDVNRWSRYLAPYLSEMRLSDLTHEKIDLLVQALGSGKFVVPRANTQDVEPKAAEPISKSTILKVLHTLSAFYKWAKANKYCTVNPVSDYIKFDRSKFKSNHNPNDVPWIEDQAKIGKVYQTLKLGIPATDKDPGMQPSPSVAIAFALSVLAGLRPSEAIAVRWEDIKLDRKKLYVAQAVRHGRIGPPKNGTTRAVDLSDSLTALLSEIKGSEERTGLVAAPLRGEADGAHLGPATIKAALDKALKANSLPDMDFYQAGRHTFASQWVSQGFDIFILSKQMGHKDVSTTANHYAHLKSIAKVLMPNVKLLNPSYQISTYASCHKVHSSCYSVYTSVQL